MTAPAKGGASFRPVPAITLQPLQPDDPLLLKWQLAETLPPPHEGDCPQTPPTAGEQADEGGQLRLRAWREGAEHEQWECHIPFSLLAREGGMVLGRCPYSADIALPLESISRRHALLEIAETGLVITDLASTNGTRVNEQVLSPFDRRVPLFHGSSLLLGDTNLRLEYIR